MNTNETNSNRMEQIISILNRETSEKLIDPKDIQSRLIDIINSVGIPTKIDGMSADEIEFAEAFNEAAPEWPKNAVATERAEHYEKILSSATPLQDGLVQDIYRTEINACARDRQLKPTSPLKRLDPRLPSPRLTERLEHDLALLRQCAESLKSYYQNCPCPLKLGQVLFSIWTGFGRWRDGSEAIFGRGYIKCAASDRAGFKRGQRCCECLS